MAAGIKGERKRERRKERSSQSGVNVSKSHDDTS